MSAPTTVPEVSMDKPLPPELWPNIDHLVIEDNEPVDGIYAEKQQRLLTEPLFTSWEAGKPFVAMANVGVFYGIRVPPIVPDMLLSKGVEQSAEIHEKRHNSYFVWEFAKPPDAVVEVVSN